MGGFFGSTSNSNCVADVFYGTDYHSHLGTHRGGMAFWNGEKFIRYIHDISNSPFRTRFENDFANCLTNDKLKSGIGSISDTDDQPLLFYSHLGKFALMTVGLITNLDEIIKEFLSDNTYHFAAMQSGEITPTEVVGALINSQDSFVEGIKNVQKRIKGSCSLLILTDKGEIYAARDYYGRTPVIIGKKDDSYAVTIESSAFLTLGYEHVKDLGPGEIVCLSNNNCTTLAEPQYEKMAICSFFYVYYGFPASTYEGINVEESRYRNGAQLAEASCVPADIVAGIPDSGVSHALGFADQSKIRYARPFIKYTPTWARSFTPTRQSMRKHIAKMKLLAIKELIKDKSIIFCDDSIVRGTQLMDQMAIIRKAEAREVHMRIACPPLLYPCKFLNFSSSRSVLDLATRRVIKQLEGDNADISKYRDPDGAPYKNMVDILCEQFKLDSLAFQRLDDFKKALGLKGICTFCWNGEDVSMPHECPHGCHCCSHTEGCMPPEKK